VIEIPLYYIKKYLRDAYMSMRRTLLGIEYEIPSDDLFEYMDRRNREWLGKLFNINLTKTQRYFDPKRIESIVGNKFDELVADEEEVNVVEWLKRIRQ
jgi:hypothetical protein